MMRFGFFAIAVVAMGCAASPAPEPLTQAEAVSDSPAAHEAGKDAPQAHAAASALLDEARALHEEGASDEAAIVAERAMAAFEEAFALVRAAHAEQRFEAAEVAVEKAQQRLTVLEERRRRAEADARAFELRARVALDEEEIVDVDSLSPERARARRHAAIQLSSEARLLCSAATLLGAESERLNELNEELGELTSLLDQGSVQKSVYPRAADARSACLKQLSLARRDRIREAPQAPGSDLLLEQLAKTGKVFAFRDDRGVVVNLLEPVDEDGEPTEAAEPVLRLLAATSKQHPEMPLMVVGHAARRAEEVSARASAEAVARALEAGGATDVTVHAAGTTQPVVDGRVPGADERNSRVEVVFVAPGR